MSNLFVHCFIYYFFDLLIHLLFFYFLLLTLCVRLSRLLVGFRTHFKSMHFHYILFDFISHSDIRIERQNWQ